MKHLRFTVLVITACTSSKAAPDGVPCEQSVELYMQIAAANTYTHDKPDATEAAKQAVLGKRASFKNCKFSRQGNDNVSFEGAGGKDLDCAMAGGEDAVRTFRHAAMEFDMKKLKLDVTGVVAEKDGRVQLTECKITPHE